MSVSLGSLVLLFSGLYLMNLKENHDYLRFQRAAENMSISTEIIIEIPYFHLQPKSDDACAANKLRCELPRARHRGKVGGLTGQPTKPRRFNDSRRR